MDRRARIDRNLAIAQKYFDGYHGSVARGRLSQVFDPDDFAHGWVFCSPYLGGETTQDRSTFLADGAVANHATIWQRIPDYKMDQFRAWPTESGCAWRWCVNGHGLDGEHREFWEQLFIWTDDSGKVTRFEFYDDWHGFAQTLTYAYDLTLDQFSRIDGYGSSPWNPGPTITISPPPGVPSASGPGADRARRNQAIAQDCFDSYRSSPHDSWIEGLAAAERLDSSCTFFSPWFGEVVESTKELAWPLLAIGGEGVRRRLADFRVGNFDAWPTDAGCAWRWKLAGRTADGAAYEAWQQIFVDIGEAGKITRVESYFDWQGFPQMLGYVSGIALEDLWHPDIFRAWGTRRDPGS